MSWQTRRYYQAVDSAVILDILHQGPANTQKTEVRNNSQGVALAASGQGPKTTQQAGFQQPVIIMVNNN